MEPTGSDELKGFLQVFPASLINILNPFNLVIAILGFLSVALMKLLFGILNPINYELDMTSEKFCKKLAEIDNSLRFRRGHHGEFHPSNKSNNSSSGSPTRSFAGDCVESDLTSGTGGVSHIYPNGWIPVMESKELRPNSFRDAIIFGRDVVVTRSADGSEVSVLGAYCPHEGSHIGGRVKLVDNQFCIQCPAHGWIFRASDGQCVQIPYQKSGSRCSTIPKQAKLETWPTLEVDNFIYVWHHIDNQPPNWSMQPSPELARPGWQLTGRTYHLANMELRDMLENGADMNHFESIHNDLYVFGSSMAKLESLKFLQKYIRHHWLPDWHPVLDDTGKMTHKAEMRLQSWIRIFNLRLFDITVRATQIGPARVNLYYNSNFYGTGLLIMNSIPMGGRRTKYIQHLYTQRTLFQCFMAKMFLHGEIQMLERDFHIWNHKKNITNPVLVPEDKTIKQFRLWYSQFYRRKRNIPIRNPDSTRKNLEEDISKKCEAHYEF